MYTFHAKIDCTYDSATNTTTTFDYDNLQRVSTRYNSQHIVRLEAP